VQALAELGWCRHPRFQEALSWLEEDAVSWGDTVRDRSVTAVATLATLTACSASQRTALRERAVGELVTALADRGSGVTPHLGHPNLGRTDLAEIVWALARERVPLVPEVGTAARRLQNLQLEGGRWRRTAPVPATLPIQPNARPRHGAPSRWITLRAALGILHYAVEAGLPRMFPAKPVA
jgi:hypothetical protein